MTIIPMPKELIALSGTYTGSRALTVSPADHARFAVAWTTFNLAVTPAVDGAQTLLFCDNPGMGPEEYELLIEARKIEIISSGDQGAFRAISTLKQILAQDNGQPIGCLKIHDKPDIPCRGIMMTVTESTVPRMDYLYHLADLMALLKYNVLQLYFDSVVFEYDHFRQYEAGKICLSQQEIHDLDRYCRERHIELMANQELLGHMHNWLIYDEFKDLAIQVPNGRKAFTLNPLSDKALDFAKTILDDLLPHYTASNVHIGMDEAYGLGLYETEDYCKTFGEGTLLAEYIAKISAYIKEKYHKRSMLWGDYVVKYRDALKQLPKDVIIVDWGYEPGHSFDRNILACHEQGLEVYVSPGTQTWGAFSGKTDIMVQNIFEAAEAGRFHGVKGFLLTDWDPADFKLTCELAYTMGAAFSWNAGYNNSIAESGNEQNCRYRNRVVHDVLKFFDDVVLHSDGKRSCADIIYRMGNYYHLEQPDCVATWNGSLLFNTLFAPGLKDGELSAETLLEIAGYMERLKSGLAQCHLNRPDADELLNELSLEIDTVIAATRAVGIRNAKDKTEQTLFAPSDTDALLARRLVNYARYNRPSDQTNSRLTKLYGALSGAPNA